MWGYIFGGATTLISGGLLWAVVALIRSNREYQTDNHEMATTLAGERKKFLDLTLTHNTLTANHLAVSAALTDAEKSVARERGARLLVERQRDELLEEVAKHGPASTLGAAIRNELRLLQELSDPTAAPTADRTRRDADSSVHGADAKAAAKP